MREFFFILLTCIVLGLYLYLWGSLIWRLLKNKPPMEGSGLFSAANASAGIATSLAITVLGATPPDESFSFANLSSLFLNISFIKPLTFAFLFGWVIIGLSCLLSGGIRANPNPDDPRFSILHNTIKNYGVVWFGMVISIVALYFGLR